MGYFRKFLTLPYGGSEVQNILTAVLPSRLNIDKSFVYQSHTVADGESAESLSEKLYGTSHHYWTIFVINAVINPYTDWPLASDVIEEFVDKKYGDKYAIHHFWDNQKNRIVDDFDDAEFRLVPVSTLPFYIIPVSNLEYETDLNNRRREIVVVNPRYIDRFVEAYNDAIQGKSE